jgi:hypothetical protein
MHANSWCTAQQAHLNVELIEIMDVSISIYSRWAMLAPGCPNSLHAHASCCAFPCAAAPDAPRASSCFLGTRASYCCAPRLLLLLLHLLMPVELHAREVTQHVYPNARERAQLHECWHFLASLVLGCHPQHNTKSVVVLYSCHLTI